MAHEIGQYDNMLSVHKTPWHGLGVVLDDYPTIKEAQIISGLTWTVRKEPVCFQQVSENDVTLMPILDNFAVVRNDLNIPLGIVGKQYEPYQNEQMFAFMDTFTKTANSKIETCGSLRNGRVVWALAQAGTSEYVKNDPTNQYFLFKNGFDGSQNIEVCFTNVRVVCNNTLTAALRTTKNVWRIRHTSSLHAQMDTVQAAIASQIQHEAHLANVMQELAKTQLTSAQVNQIVAEIVIADVKEADEYLQDAKDLNALATKHQLKVIHKILALHDIGVGTDIKGVRGTAYGVLQACTEYADHYRTIRRGDRSYAEARFESIMMGSSHQFKTTAFDYFLNMLKKAA